MGVDVLGQAYEFNYIAQPCYSAALLNLLVIVIILLWLVTNTSCLTWVQAIIFDKYGSTGCNVGEIGGFAPNISRQVLLPFMMPRL